MMNENYHSDKRKLSLKPEEFHMIDDEIKIRKLDAYQCY